MKIVIKYKSTFAELEPGDTFYSTLSGIHGIVLKEQLNKEKVSWVDMQTGEIHHAQKNAPVTKTEVKMDVEILK